MTISQREYCALLRLDLGAFTHRCFVELSGGARLEPGGHLEVMSEALWDVLYGGAPRLIINVPPRHLKSITASVAFVAWCLGQMPDLKFICVSYGQDLADKHARDCRRIMTSKWYQQLFPGTRLAGKQSISEFETTKGGGRIATSVGGVLTGRGANIIVIDDPQKPDEILSESQRRSTNEWFDNTLYSRLDDKTCDAIVIVMQRLHEDDLVGHVLEQEKWKVLRFPAIAEEDEVHEYFTPLGPGRFSRQAGEALHPAREPLETLQRIRATIGEYNFAGQYQQAPAPQSGGLVKRDWFRTYKPHERPAHVLIVQSWDTASKDTELSDYSVCTTWAVVDNKAYLLHVLRERLDYPNLKRKVREQQSLHGASVVLIEDKASGIALAQELIYEGLYAVQRYRPQLEKTLRLHAQTGMIENGFVFVPEAAPWLDAFLHELTVFPRGKHDDQVDSTSQFLEWLKQRSMQPTALFGSYGS